MIHLVMNVCQNLVWPHYGKCMIFVVVLMVYLLVVGMLDVFPLVSIVQLHADRMSVSKAFICFPSSTTCELVAISLCSILRKLLVLNDTQLRQTNEYITHILAKMARSLTSNKIGPLFCSSILFLQAKPFENLLL